MGGGWGTAEKRTREPIASERRTAHDRKKPNVFELCVQGIGRDEILPEQLDRCSLVEEGTPAVRADAEDLRLPGPAQDHGGSGAQSDKATVAHTQDFDLDSA